jgi:hypothetical protein
MGTNRPVHGSYSRGKKVMHSGQSLPQTPPSFLQGPGHVPASTWADGGAFRLALEGARDQIIRNRRGADASPASNRDAGPGSVREFPQFEHGAGI